MKFAGALAGLAVLLLAGCWNSPPTAATQDSASLASASAPPAAPANHKSAAEWTANEILQQLLARYRQAKTYRDDAVVRLSFRRDGQKVAEEAPAAISFQRPDKLSIVAYQATVKCDGK